MSNRCKSTNFECQPDSNFPDILAIGNGIGNPNSLTCNNPDPSFKYESLLPLFDLLNEETPALNNPEYGKQGPFVSSYLSDISDEEFDFEDLSKVSFGEDFFQTLDYAV